MKNEHDANLAMVQSAPAWQHPSTSRQHYNPKKQPGIVGQYLGASAVGLILATPFIVQIFIDFAKA